MSFLHIAHHPMYAHPLPAGHRFPMLKYELIPAQLLHEGVVEKENLVQPKPCNNTDVLLTHTNEYLQKLLTQTLSDKEQRVIGFPQSPALTQRELIIAHGTIDCAVAALQNGVALNTAGGTHHAFADKGEGFCLLNDIAVASNYLLHHNLAEKILVVDLDVHQGNGTAKIFEQVSEVFTFSMHGKHNYPFHKEKSDCDVGLMDGICDGEYLLLLQEHLKKIVAAFSPNIVFYQSGVDVLATDKFGKLKLTMEGCKKRDELVFGFFSNKNIPVAAAMGGGYSPNVRDIVTAHCNTFKAAKFYYGL